MFKLKYNSEQKSLVIKDSKNNIVYEENKSASNPQISPNKTKIAFISPYEWESLSSLYLFNPEDKKWIYVNILDTNSLSFHCLLFNRY